MLKQDYCDKCGWIWSNFDYTCHVKAVVDIKRCDICGNELKPVPTEYYGEDGGLISAAMKQKLIETLVKPSPNFDQYYFDNAINIKGRKDDVFNTAMSRGKEILQGTSAQGTCHTPKCPTCQSTNIRRIGGIERGASILTFGLFSSKINKSFKCNSCGYTW